MYIEVPMCSGTSDDDPDDARSSIESVPRVYNDDLF